MRLELASRALPAAVLIVQATIPLPADLTAAICKKAIELADALLAEKVSKPSTVDG